MDVAAHVCRSRVFGSRAGGAGGEEQTHDFETNSQASKLTAGCMTGCRSKCRTNLKKAFGLELSELDAEHPGDEI